MGSWVLDGFDYGERIACMATLEELGAAKKKMESAEAALRVYLNRSADVDADPVLHQRLTECLQQAQDEFLETLQSGDQ